MEQTPQQKNACIVSMAGDGKYKELNKYKVSLNNGDNLTFFSKLDFPHKVGDVINYIIKNEKYGTAKLVQQNYNSGGSPEYSREDLIIRQVAFKSACEHHWSGLCEEDQIESFTKIFFNIIKS